MFAAIMFSPPLITLRRRLRKSLISFWISLSVALDANGFIRTGSAKTRILHLEQQLSNKSAGQLNYAAQLKYTTKLHLNIKKQRRIKKQIKCSIKSVDIWGDCDEQAYSINKQATPSLWNTGEFQRSQLLPILLKLTVGLLVYIVRYSELVHFLHHNKDGF